MTPELLALKMGLDIPDFDLTGYYGAGYGTMKPFHRVGSLLFLSGHVAQIGAEVTHKGRLGADLTTEQGYAAPARPGSMCWAASGRLPARWTASKASSAP